jgi:hypothetical protein
VMLHNHQEHHNHRLQIAPISSELPRRLIL